MKRKGIVDSKFLTSVNYSFIILCNKSSCCEHLTGGLNIYLYECVSLLAPECAMCVLHVWYQIRVYTSKKPIMCQTSVNLAPCCITHIKVFLVLRYHGSTCVDPYYKGGVFIKKETMGEGAGGSDCDYKQ